MHKNVFVFFLCFSVSLLAGFVSVNYYIDVDENEITQVKLVAKIDKVMEIEEVEEYIEQNFYRHLTDDPLKRYGYQLYETDEHIIFEIQPNYTEESKLNIAHFGEFNFLGPASSHIKTLPFYERCSYDWSIKIADEAIEGYVTQKHIPDDIDIKIYVTLPFTVKEHNADIIRGKTMVWSMDPFHENHIQFTYVKNELYKPILFIIVVTLIIFISQRLSKEKRENFK